MKILPIPIKEDSTDFELANEFRKAYKDYNGIRQCCILTDAARNNSSDSNPFVFVRIFIENPDRITDYQNYIIALQSFDYGQRITIDVISLNLNRHKHIANTYCRLNKWTKESGIIDNKRLSVTDQVPIAFSGGQLQFTTTDKLSFYGKNAEYGSDVFGTDCNDLARYLAFNCNHKVESKTKKGESFIKELLQLMRQYRGSRKFYEKWLSSLRKRLDHKGVNPLLSQQMAALQLMLTEDRYMYEGGDYMKILAEETTVDLKGKYIIENLLLPQSLKRTASDFLYTNNTFIN